MNINFDIGCVGSNLRRQRNFSHLYNSKNIDTMENQSFNTIFFCGCKKI